MLRRRSVILASGSNALLTLFWNFSGFLFGNCTIESYAELVGGETKTREHARKMILKELAFVVD